MVSIASRMPGSGTVPGITMLDSTEVRASVWPRNVSAVSRPPIQQSSLWPQMILPHSWEVDSTGRNTGLAVTSSSSYWVSPARLELALRVASERREICTEAPTLMPFKNWVPPPTFRNSGWRP